MKAKLYYKMTLVAVCLLSSCLFSAPALLAYNYTFTDNFNDNSMNTNFWQLDTNGLPTINEVNNQVEVSIPGNIVGESWAGYNSRLALRGDFDMQVDYHLITLPWPSNSGCSVELYLFSIAFSNREDYINGLGEVYEADIINTPSAYVTTTDTSGTLRITRTGNTIDCYYMGSGGWVNTISFTDASLAQDEIFGFSAGGWPPNFGGQDLLVAFDNFQLQYDELVPIPIPSSLLLLGGGLIGLGLPGLRRRIKKG
jgi:hypothetical protein